MLSIIQEKFFDQPEEISEEEPETSFEEALNQYIYQLPRRGQILEGEVEAINDDAIILDVGLKRAAIVPGREVGNLDDEVITNLSLGDVIPIKVKQTPVGDQDLLVSIDDALQFQSWQLAKDCKQENRLLELEVTGSNRGGLLVSFDKIQGFVPNSHIPALKKIYDPQQKALYKQKLKGTKLKVQTLAVNSDEEKLVFSALKAQSELRQERINNLEVGEVIKGKVSNVVDFGVFVNLGGIDGLVHISELDWRTVDHPSDIAKPGDEIEVQVLGIDTDRERVRLSRKTQIPSPWEVIESNYVAGDLIEVEITHMVDFGAFATLPEGVQGLIHKSELGYTEPDDIHATIQPGISVLVTILKIDKARERIALSMRKVPMEKQIDWMLNSTEEETRSDNQPPEETNLI
jgi:small subunit ribosomal protein S1